MAKILIIDDEQQLRGLLARIIGLEGYEVAQAPDCAAGLKMLRQYDPDVVLCDVKLPDGNGVEMVGKIKETAPSAEVILLTAFDYITKGDDNNKILPLLSRAAEKAQMQRRLARFEEKLSDEHSFDRIIGSSEALRQAVALARKVAATNTSVLLTGETGTGKEVFAQAIHHAGPRAKESFVAVNCSAVSKELLESELFGHRAGSFTGASKDKKGLFEEADRGTLFLDEIGEMPVELQAKLLRVLESGEFIKIGETRPTKVDLRIIAATNRDLEKEIAAGNFREDLFFRLSVFRIQLPSLNGRKKDIAEYARHFAEQFAAKMGKRIEKIDDTYIAALERHTWRGNVRELRNIVAAGVRMFDLRPSASGSSLQDLPIHHGIAALGDPTRGGYTPGGSGRQELPPFMLSHLLDRFVNFLNEHPDETVLIHMKYENTSGTGKTGWDKSVVDLIKSHCSGHIADFHPRMTLADARGKILFMIREDYKSANGGRYLGAYLNWTHDKVVFETTLHGNTGETAPIKVNDLYNIKNGSSDGVSKYAAIDECIAYTYGATDVTRWCMNYVSCYDTAHCSVSGISLFGAVGDYDYCANLYNRYTADKLNRKDFRGNAGIVLMDFAGAENATMTYGQTYSNMRVYGDDLVKAVIGVNNKWDLRRSE